MSVNSFKFVSPGIFVNEVDNSQLPKLAEPMGPVIIGRAERGPGMVPIKVSSFAEFVEIFGEPLAGASANDGWRDGNKVGPTYGAFAAQAYLKNGSPITFVRLLGEKNEDAQSGGEAGWKMDKAYGIYVGNASADHLAGIFYTNSSTAPGSPDATAGVIELSVPIKGSSVAGVAERTVLTFDNTTFVARYDAAVTGATVIQADENDDGTTTADFVITLTDFMDLALKVKLDPNSITNSLNTALTPDVLTVGIGGGADLAGSLVKIKDAINDIGADLKVVASSGATTLTLVNEELGDPATVPASVNESPLTTHGTIATATQPNVGSAAVPGSDSQKKFKFTLSRNDKNYIRKVLNTNPTAVNSRVGGPGSTEEYFLGPTFDQDLEDAGLNLATIDTVSVSAIAGYENFEQDASAPRSPTVYSQFTGDKSSLTADLVKTDLTPLFTFHSLYAGEWEQKNFKITVANVRASADEFNPYGTFSIHIRDAKDSDSAQIIYERFSNLTLDPTSASYIGSAIGDMKMSWDPKQRRYDMLGQFPNKSKYIRVEVAPGVASGEASASLLPFAFAAPKHVDIDTGKEPLFAFRENTNADKTLTSVKNACFGITTDRPGQHGRFDESYQDIVRPLKGDEDLFAADGVLFSLDKLKIASGHCSFNAASDEFRSGVSKNGATGLSTAILDEGFNSFTLPLAGGLDGLDIKEVEPFCDPIVKGQSALTSYAYNSISKAIDTVADPEVVECNIMTIPGCSDNGLTGKLISTCEARADALAIVDLAKDYVPSGWDTNSGNESLRQPKVDDAIAELKSRAISSSYACTFFPWVQVNDTINNRLVWMPPSVAALGTMASSAAKSELWFAPAGFTRGGLSAGAGGLPVSQVKLRLNSKERDKLYDANINPIAQFPAEGIVIFGQKTLQVTPSALDRINVRRLMIHVKKEISRMAATVLFDQNVEATWMRFTSKAEPFLASVKARFGLTEYRIVLDETTTTPELIDRNIMYAKIYLKPARAIEFIAIDFVITNTGASFDD